MDPKELKIPNICFSLTKENDKREEKFKKQRIKRGFDDSETWSLRDTIGNFILPRLKRFKKVSQAHPGNMTHEEWMEILNKMIKSFKLLTKDNGSFTLNKKEEKEFNEGMKLFNDHFLNLWW